MKTRLKQVRKQLGLSQQDFGKALGVSNTAISKLENGENNVTDQMAKLIRREFNVDYIWLTTGKGEMFSSDEVEFARLVDRVMDSEDEFIRGFFKTFASLSADQWDLLKDIAFKISKNSINKSDPE